MHSPLCMNRSRAHKAAAAVPRCRPDWGSRPTTGGCIRVRLVTQPYRYSPLCRWACCWGSDGSASHPPKPPTAATSVIMSGVWIFSVFRRPTPDFQFQPFVQRVTVVVFIRRFSVRSETPRLPPMQKSAAAQILRTIWFLSDKGTTPAFTPPTPHAKPCRMNVEQATGVFGGRWPGDPMPPAPPENSRRRAHSRQPVLATRASGGH